MSIATTEAGQGAALVCLHGGMGIDGRTLRVPGILGLAERGLRVIVGLPGHGRVGPRLVSCAPRNDAGEGSS